MEKQMEKQTPERIKQEIEHLMAIKPTVLRWSFFGDDHHATIDAQIFVLQTTMEEDDIHEEMGHDADNVLDAALAARMWLDAQYEDYPDLAAQWKELVR